MVLNRTFGDTQAVRDFFVAQVPSQKFHDLPLARGKPGRPEEIQVSVSRQRRQPGKQNMSNMWRATEFTFTRRLDDRKHLPKRGVSRNIPARSGLCEFHYTLFRFQQFEHNNRRILMLRCEVTD